MGWLVSVSVLLSLGIALLHAQNSGTPASGTPASQQSPGSPSSETKPQDNSIPDAPSTVQPAKPLPQNPPPNSEPTPPAPPQSVAPVAPAEQNPADNSAPATQGGKREVPINIRPTPPEGTPNAPADDQVETYTLPVRVNQVLLPVTVTDEAGHLVTGLTYKDFTVLENGKKQKLNFFTSSTFAVSAAVVVDLGMKDVDLQKVNHTYAALQGAFSEFDELSVYTYGNVVGQLTGWGAVGPALSARLDELSNVRGQDNGPPVTSGPIASGVPMINNYPVDPATPRPVAATQPARVMNDAILKAALDLSRREKARRKIKLLR